MLPRSPAAAWLLLAVAGVPAVAAAIGSAALADAGAALAAMKTAVTKVERLHAIVRAEEREGGVLKTTRFIECWIDVKGGRLRVELREWKRAAPHLAAVSGPGGVRYHQLQFDEIAGQKRALELAAALPACFAGELLSTAFRGDLVTFKAAAYGKPTLGGGENLDGVGCTRLTFSGNLDADLWIGDEDQIPRRIRGPIPSASRASDAPAATLDETLVLLELDPKLDRVDFEMTVPEGRRIAELDQVRERWQSPPDEKLRWPRPEVDAPDFAAVDLDARVRMLSETGEQQVVLAFWSPEDERSVALAAEAEQAWRAAGSELAQHLPFLHVAAGAARPPVEQAAANQGLQAPVWVAGSHAQDAFRRWCIWRCPVFVRVDDMQVRAITDDVNEAKSWFK